MTNTARIDQRRAVWLVRWTGAAVLVLAAVLFAVMPQRPVRTNVDGLQGAVIGFELATSPAHVVGILGTPTDAERPAVVQAMDRANRIDFLFMIAYPALCVAIAWLLVSRGLAPRWLVGVVGLFAFAMLAGDFVENLQLLVLSQTTDVAAMLGPLAVLRVATRIKWAALFVTAILEGAYVARDATAWRWSAVAFVGAGLLGLVGFRWLPGIEQAANLLAVGWAWTWIHALRTRLE